MWTAWGEGCRVCGDTSAAVAAPPHNAGGLGTAFRQEVSSFQDRKKNLGGMAPQSIFPCPPPPALAFYFPPVAVPRKALLINSANLMGGSSEPDGMRGFGRVHLEAGMPLAGNGSLVLFVADAANTSISELTRQEYNFTVDGSAGLDLRVTLSWIDPPVATFSAKQLAHDLDLSVISPNGTRYTMWDSGETDTVNVNERVIVDAGDVESGAWLVWVWAKALGTPFQNYSLVVNGAVTAAAVDGASGDSTSTSDESSSSTGSDEATNPPALEPDSSSGTTDPPAEEPGSSSDEDDGPTEGAGSSGGSLTASPAAARLGMLVCVLCGVVASGFTAAAKGV